MDLISSRRKACTFDCIYCQLGKTKDFSQKRKIFVPEEEVIEEIKSLPDVRIGYITFSGRGEPTLAKNLGLVIDAIKNIRNEKIAILTNSSLMHKQDVREELSKGDLVIAKLDAPSQMLFRIINMPMQGIKLDRILEGIKEFRKEYKTKLALQIMFVRENKSEAEKLAQIVREIMPDEVEINTPLRPCGVTPLPQGEVLQIKEYFKGLNPICVYNAGHKKVSAINRGDTLKRRGKVIDGM